MSAHVLLNLLNKLGKRDKMFGKPHILSLHQLIFRNEFNEFNNTGARKLRYYSSHDIKITFWALKCKILPSFKQR